METGILARLPVFLFKKERRSPNWDSASLAVEYLRSLKSLRTLKTLRSLW